MVKVSIGGKTPSQIVREGKARGIDTKTKVSIGGVSGREIVRRGGGGGSSQSSRAAAQQQAAARAQAETARIAKEAAARRELERARAEAVARETANKEAARRDLAKAVERARAIKSVSQQERAREVFAQAQDIARVEREKAIIKGKETFKSTVTKARKDTKETIPDSRRKSKLSTFGEGFEETQTGRVFNLISGGSLQKRALDRRQSDLDFEIERFNKEFGGKELSEKEFDAATTVQENLEKKEKKLTKDSDALIIEVSKGVKG